MIANRRTEAKTPAVPTFPDIMIGGDTPSKKRKLGEEQAQAGVSQFPTYAGVTMQGVQPLHKQQKGMRILQSMLQQQPQPKPQRNIVQKQTEKELQKIC